MRADLCVNQPVSRVHRIERRETHTATPSSWRRVDGVEVMIEPRAEKRRDNLISTQIITIRRGRHLPRVDDVLQY